MNAPATQTANEVIGMLRNRSRGRVITKSVKSYDGKIGDGEKMAGSFGFVRARP